MANTQRQAHRPELAGTQTWADAKKKKKVDKVWQTVTVANGLKFFPEERQDHENQIPNLTNFLKSCFDYIQQGITRKTNKSSKLLKN